MQHQHTHNQRRDNHQTDYQHRSATDTGQAPPHGLDCHTAIVHLQILVDMDAI